MWRRLLIGLLVLTSLAAVTGRAILDVRDFLGELPHPASEVTMLIGQLILALPAMGWTASGCVLAIARPRNVLGWLFLVFGVLLSCAGLLGRVVPEVSARDTAWQLELSLTLNFVLLLSLPSVLLALYPDGRLPAPWWRWPVCAAIAGIAMTFGIPVLAQHFRIPTSLAYAVGTTLIVTATGTIVVASFARWRRAVYPYRQQLAWFAGCGVVSYVCYFVAVSASVYHRTRGTVLVVSLTDPMLVIPIGVAVGVLRYRLLGINVLRRGLVYGTLTILVFTVYLITSVVLGEMLKGTQLAGVALAAIVAFGLAPARDRLQRAADRLVYGARRDPLQALAELSDSVAANDQADLVPAALAAITAAVRADGAVIVTADGTVLASAGEEPGRFMAMPLRFRGAEIGELRVAEPREGGYYTGADLRLLTALAAQLALVVSAAELTEALEAERIRVVAATRDERDRLRRDLHDGLGPSLTGMSLGLQALSGMIDDGSATALVRRLRAETDSAVHDIRRIIDGLRPTALDTAGLTQAVASHAGTLDSALPVDVTTEDLPVLAPDVEVAAYRIITEALTNAARHAHARHAKVTISADEALHIAVSDDGCGISEAHATNGVGLSSMRRRAEALGGGLAIHSTDGGTTVTATLPLRGGER